MNIFKQFFLPSHLILALFGLGSMNCGQPPIGTMHHSGESVVVTAQAEINTVCLDSEDCDGDGLSDMCDDDDQDATNTDMIDGCDVDEDGFVDEYCTDNDEDGDGYVTAEERDINCDVCPGVYNPDQADSDEDGIGDECQ